MELPAWVGALTLESKRGLIARIWRSIFGARIESADPVFDAMFWIGGPPDHARAVLTPPVRAALLTFGAAHGAFAVSRGRLSWSRRTYAVEGLDRVIEAMGRLTAALG
jgi:hypothetical protein